MPRPAALQGHSDAINALCVLPDGQLASASSDCTIRIWDTASSGRCERVLCGHSLEVWALCVLHDGLLASGSFDTSIRLWDTSAGQTRLQLLGHSGWVRAVCEVQPDRLASSSDDRTIRIWDTMAGTCVSVLKSSKVHDSGPGHVALCMLHNGLLASGSGDHRLWLWNVEAASCVRVIEDPSIYSYALCVLGDGMVVTGSREGALSVWDPTTYRHVSTFGSSKSRTWSLCTLPNGTFVSGSYERAVYVWDPVEMQCLRILQAHQGEVNAVALLPNGRLASGSRDANICIWSLADEGLRVPEPARKPERVHHPVVTMEADGYSFRVSLPFTESLVKPGDATVTHYLAYCLTEPTVRAQSSRSPAELEGWFRRGIGHIFQVVSVTAWGEGMPSDATEAAILAEHPLQPTLAAALPAGVDELLRSLMRDGWDSLWALRSRGADRILEVCVAAPEARASLLRAVKQAVMPTLPDAELPLASFLARLLNLSGERGTALADLLGAELHIESWEQLKAADYGASVRPMLEAAGVLAGIIEALGVAVDPPTRADEVVSAAQLSSVAEGEQQSTGTDAAGCPQKEDVEPSLTAVESAQRTPDGPDASIQAASPSTVVAFLMRMKFDQTHAEKLAGLLGAMCLDHIDLLVSAVKAGTNADDFVAGGLPRIAANLIIQEVKALSQLQPVPAQEPASLDIQLSLKYFIDGTTAFESVAGGKVVIASGYYNGPRVKPYKFKLSTDYQLLSREKQVLDDIASTAHGSSQTCSLDHVVKCKEEIIGPLTLEGVLEGAQCWAIVLEPGEYDLRYVLEQHYDVVFGGANALNVIATAKAVLEAIRTINEAGFVWRDAKPENFIYRQKMRDKVSVGRWKAIDMGSALECGATHDDSVTPRYCPPEVARFLLGRQPGGPEGEVLDKAYASFDAWSAGVMLLELFDGGKNQVLLQRGLSEPREVLEFVASPTYHEELLKRLDVVMRADGRMATLRSIITLLLSPSERERSQAVAKSLERSVFTNKEATVQASSIIQKQLDDLVEQGRRVEARVNKGFNDISADLSSLRESLAPGLEQLARAALPPPTAPAPAGEENRPALLDLRPQGKPAGGPRIVNGLLDFRGTAEIEKDAEARRVELADGLLDLRKLGKLSAEGISKADRATLRPEQVMGMVDQMKGLGRRLLSLGSRVEPSEGGAGGALKRAQQVITTDHSQMARQVSKAEETGNVGERLELLQKVMERLERSVSTMNEQFNSQLEALAQQHAQVLPVAPQAAELQVDTLSSEIEHGNDILESAVQKAEARLYAVLHKGLVGTEDSLAAKLLDQQGAILSAISSVTYASVSSRPDVLVGLQGSFDHLRASMAIRRGGEGESKAQHEAVTDILSSLERLSDQLRSIEEKTERLEGLAHAQLDAVHTLLQGDYECPSLMILEPAKSKRRQSITASVAKGVRYALSPQDWGRGEYKMLLVCHVCLCPTKCGPSQSGYQVKKPSDFLRKYAPLIKLTVQLIKAAARLAQTQGIPNLVVGLEGYTSIDEHVSSLMDADGCRAITEGCDAIATNQPVVPRGGDIKRLTGPALEHLRGLLDEVDKDRQHYGLYHVTGGKGNSQSTQWVCRRCKNGGFRQHGLQYTGKFKAVKTLRTEAMATAAGEEA